MCAGVIRADDRRRTPPFSPPFTVQKDVTTTSLKGGRFFFLSWTRDLIFYVREADATDSESFRVSTSNVGQ